MLRLWTGLALLAIAFVVASRKGGVAWKEIGTSAAWIGGLYGAAYALHVAVRGGFDFTAVNSRASYIPACLAIGLLAGLPAIALHRGLWRSWPRLLRDQLTALGLLLGANILHPLAFGWPLGFPLPCAPLLVFPFFGAILLVSGGILTVALGLLAARAK
ncbi:hypothetical protein BH11MYX4_BH11MYX4_48290 [soil metagenome]